jgi:hypothetical protein
MFPSRYLQGSSITQPIVVTIDHVAIETLGSGVKAERKGVAYFVEDVKPLVVNKTNWDTLVQLTGEPNSDNWGGTVIELFAIDTNGPQGPARGTRIRAPRKPPKRPSRAPHAKAPATADGEPSDEGF